MFSFLVMGLSGLNPLVQHEPSKDSSGRISKSFTRDRAGGGKVRGERRGEGSDLLTVSLESSRGFSKGSRKDLSGFPHIPTRSVNNE